VASERRRKPCRVSSAVEQSPAARSIGCKACLDPGRWSRHCARLGCNVIEARRDQVVDHYVRLLESEREIAKALGLSASIVHSDLVARRVTMRPQARGLRRGLETPEDLQALQDGNRRYRADVERVKAERGLIDRDELLKRLRRAGLPRTKPMIARYIRSGLLEREHDLGFDKPWLFSTAAVDELVTRLRSSPDPRYHRFNSGDERLDLVERFHGKAARSKAGGRMNSLIAAEHGKRNGRPGELDEHALAEIRARSASETQREIALHMGISRGQVQRALAKKVDRNPL